MVVELWKQKDEFKADYESEVLNPKKKSNPKGLCDEVEQCLITWISQMRSKSVPVTVALIKAHAEYFSNKLGIQSSLKWSEDWIQNIRQRHNLIFIKLHGEAADADTNGASVWKEHVLPRLIEAFYPKDIFNAEETGILWRCLTDRICERANRLKGGNLKGSKKLCRKGKLLRICDKAISTRIYPYIITFFTPTSGPSLYLF